MKNYKNSENQQNPHNIQAVKLYDQKEAEIIHLLVNSNESLKPHVTAVDVAFYVLEGKPTVLIGDEKKQLEKDDLVESPKNIVHCIYNHTKEKVRMLS